MSRGLVDTSVFIARESGRGLDETALPDEIAVSVITIGELRAGVIATDSPRVRDRRLATLEAANRLHPVGVDEVVARAWARLRIELRDVGQRMPVNDSWIAATAMALEVPVVTQDDDYIETPSLTVLWV